MTFQINQIQWNKGLTKETDERVKNLVLLSNLDHSKLHWELRKQEVKN